ncbi:endonuclease domain-containing protein [Rhodococcus sp. NPDC003382]
MIDFDEPFRGSEALEAGLVTRYGLDRHFVRLHRDVYIRPGIAPTARLRTKAAWIWSNRSGIPAGLSAAAMHGSRWIDPHAPAELLRDGHVRSVPGIVVRTARDVETCAVDGMTVTSPAQTGYDLARRHRPTVACIEMLDALCNATGLKVRDIQGVAATHRGDRGVGGLDRILALVDGGAASPPETHTRLLLIRAGLPAPETQIEVFDGDRFVARADLGWKQWRVLVEYDGSHHWTDPAQRTSDIERYALLPELGWTVIRVGADLLYRRSGVLVERVRETLRRAGAPV